MRNYTYAAGDHLSTIGSFAGSTTVVERSMITAPLPLEQPATNGSGGLDQRVHNERICRDKF